MRKLSCASMVVVFLLVLVFTTQAVVIHAYTVSYTYKLDSEGRASVTLMISGAEETYVVYVKVDKGIIPESAVATNEVGSILPVELVNESTLAIYTSNTSRDVVVTYTALVATQVMDYVEVILAPEGPATVILPKGAALLYFNGSAAVSMYDETLILTYESGGTYLIQFLPPIVTETTTTISATTTETTSPTGTTSSSPATSPTTSVITSQPTTQTGTSTPTTPATKTSPALTTSVTSHTAPIHTTTPTSGIQDWGTYIALVLVVIVAIALVVLLRRRKGASVVPGGGVTPMEGPEGFVFGGDVDERDVEILKALKNERLTISGLARKVGLSKSVIWRRVRKLTDLGLINRVDEGGRTYLSLTKEGEEFLSRRGSS